MVREREEERGGGEERETEDERGGKGEKAIEGEQEEEISMERREGRGRKGE